jgi:Flp pilus assembly protein TadG
VSRGTGDRGSVSIVAAALMCVTLVLVMGAADLARVLTVAARAQTAADAAALAAAQELAAPSAGDPAPIEIAAAYAARNDAELTACACELDTNEATVAVRVVVGPLLFAPDDRVVSASARAVVETHA